MSHRAPVGRRDDRGPLAKNGPKYLRWALIEAATHAARELASAIWHRLTKSEPFAPGTSHVTPLVA